VSTDPLVQLWQNAGRPLKWRPWQSLSRPEQARLRWLLMTELRLFDLHIDRIGAFHWRHCHRELLELKAASGHAYPGEGQP
jgi:hypothetical protein